MYKTCPKCAYERKDTDTGDAGTCPACGIIFAKYMKQQFAASESSSGKKTEIKYEENKGLIHRCLEVVFFIEAQVNPFVFYSRVLLFVFLIYYGWEFITLDFHENPGPLIRAYMHNVHLIFHEAGHVFFMPFGRFMGILGGTLGQMIMPIVVLGVFLYQQNTFGASVALWWLAHSFMDIAPYIDDAIDQKMVLLGGRTGADAPGNHDWGNILIHLNKIEKTYIYANNAYNIGVCLMIMSFAWGAYILIKQHKNIDRRF